MNWDGLTQKVVKPGLELLADRLHGLSEVGGGVVVGEHGTRAADALEVGEVPPGAGHPGGQLLEVLVGPLPTGWKPWP